MQNDDAFCSALLLQGPVNPFSAAPAPEGGIHSVHGTQILRAPMIVTQLASGREQTQTQVLWR